MIYGVTGHRPDKTGGYGRDSEQLLYNFAHYTLTSTLLPDDTIITGMAQGWDQAIALACHSLDIPFTAAIPFPNQDALWPRQARDDYRNLLKYATSAVIISQGGFSTDKMQLRNQWIVDHSSGILALHDGSRGGTYNCIQYAKGRKPIVDLWDKWQAYLTTGRLL